MVDHWDKGAYIVNFRIPTPIGLMNVMANKKEPVAEDFNLAGHKWEDITVVVIDHNTGPMWTGKTRRNSGCIY